MPLRHYQQQLVDGIRTAYRSGAQGVMAQLPTGAGKTYTALHIAKTASLRSGARTLIAVHRQELLEQWAAEAESLNIDYGLTAAQVGKTTTNPDAPIQIAMVDTLVRRTRHPIWSSAFSYLYFDEAHLGTASKWAKLRHNWPDARYIGWTATPSRLDNRGFPWCDSIITGPSYEQLETTGALVPFDTYSISGLDYTGLRKRYGEFTAASQSAQFTSQPLIGSVVNEYINRAIGRTGLVFASSIPHSQQLAAGFRKNGIPAAHIDGTTPKPLRDFTLHKLAKGDLWIVTNVGVLVEGLNITSISYIGCAFATASLTKWIQTAGRALRPHPGKTNAIICDHGGNALRHGSIDYNHQWSIAPTTKSKTTNEEQIKARICQLCCAVIPLSAKTCPVCGTVHVPAPRKIVTKTGTLTKLKRRQAPRKGRTTSLQLENQIISWVKTFR